jgi:hypothetical protein
VKTFLPLADGTVINIDTIAYFHADPGPRLPSDEPLGIQLVFPSSGTNEAGGMELHTLLLEGQDALDFLDEMDKRGVDTAAIRKSAHIAPRKESGAFAAIERTGKHDT